MKRIAEKHNPASGRQGCCLGCHTRENKEYVRTCAGVKE